MTENLNQNNLEQNLTPEEIQEFKGEKVRELFEKFNTSKEKITDFQTNNLDGKSEFSYSEKLIQEKLKGAENIEEQIKFIENLLKKINKKQISKNNIFNLKNSLFNQSQSNNYSYQKDKIITTSINTNKKTCELSKSDIIKTNILIERSSYSKNLENKKIDDYNVNEAISVLKYLNNYFNSGKYSEGTIFNLKEDRVSDLENKSDVRSFQLDLIEKILKETNDFVYGHNNEKGNFLIDKNDITINIKNGKISDINTVGLTNYIKSFEGNKELFFKEIGDFGLTQLKEYVITKKDNKNFLNLFKENGINLETSKIKSEKAEELESLLKDGYIDINNLDNKDLKLFFIKDNDGKKELINSDYLKNITDENKLNILIKYLIEYKIDIKKINYSGKETKNIYDFINIRTLENNIENIRLLLMFTEYIDTCTLNKFSNDFYENISLNDFILIGESLKKEDRYTLYSKISDMKKNEFMDEYQDIEDYDEFDDQKIYDDLLGLKKQKETILTEIKNRDDIIENIDFDGKTRIGNLTTDLYLTNQLDSGKGHNNIIELFKTGVIDNKNINNFPNFINEVKNNFELTYKIIDLFPSFYNYLSYEEKSNPIFIKTLIESKNSSLGDFSEINIEGSSINNILYYYKLFKLKVGNNEEVIKNIFLNDNIKSKLIGYINSENKSLNKTQIFSEYKEDYEELIDMAIGSNKNFGKYKNIVSKKNNEINNNEFKNKIFEKNENKINSITEKGNKAQKTEIMTILASGIYIEEINENIVNKSIKELINSGIDVKFLEEILIERNKLIKETKLDLADKVSTIKSKNNEIIDKKTKDIDPLKLDNKFLNFVKKGLFDKENKKISINSEGGKELYINEFIKELNLENISDKQRNLIKEFLSISIEKVKSDNLNKNIIKVVEYVKNGEDVDLDKLLESSFDEALNNEIEENTKNIEKNENLENSEIQKNDNNLNEFNYNFNENSNTLNFSNSGKEENLKISSEESKMIKENPKYAENLINFYTFFKNLNLLSVWEYRDELINAIGIREINNKDDSLKPEEIRKFGNNLLTFVANIGKGKNETKEKINISTVSGINKALKDFSGANSVFSDEKTHNIEGEDAFASLMRQYGIIGGAYFHTSKIRENI